MCNIIFVLKLCINIGSLTHCLLISFHLITSSKTGEGELPSLLLGESSSAPNMEQENDLQTSIAIANNNNTGTTQQSSSSENNTDKPTENSKSMETGGEKRDNMDNSATEHNRGEIKDVAVAEGRTTPREEENTAEIGDSENPAKRSKQTK